MHRRALSLAALLTALPTTAASLGAQTLRERLPELFMLGGQTVPLRLLGPADPNNPAAGAVVNDEFVPGAAQANAAVFTFLFNWVTGNVATIPIGTTSGGATFRFERGIPVKTPQSTGPIFGERGHTLGRGRLIGGVNYTGIRFTSVRGAPMNDLRLNFTSRSAALDRCENPPSPQSPSCTTTSVSANDIVALRLSLDLGLSVTSLFATYSRASRVIGGRSKTTARRFSCDRQSAML